MPWRGAETPGEFPTLGYAVADWIEAHCAIPDGERAGERFLLTDEQLRFVLWHYRLRPNAVVGKPSAPFVFRRSQLVRPQKWGKGPLSAALICAEAAGPVLFDGWDANGEPVGRRWPTPWIQVVAVSEDQTDNVWTALVPMIELGSLAANIPDTGKTRINVPGSGGSNGLIEPVTSAAVSRLGQRITFAVHDETHSWTAENRGVKLADTQRRNLAGMGGRSVETTNAWDPAEGSVAQTTFESPSQDIFRDFPPPLEGSIRNRVERRRALRHAYAGAPWVDLDRVDAEFEELLQRDPGQAARFFLNRIMAGADKAFDVDHYRSLRADVVPGSPVTLGFDGSLTRDATGLVVTDIATGHQAVVGVWERPSDLPVDDESWTVPVDEVDEAVEFAFDRWDVWRLYGDPPHWKEDLNRWAGRYGADKVVLWWTNHRKRMAYELKAWRDDMRPGVMSHGPLSDDPRDIANHEALVRHVGNAVRRPTRIRDDDDGSWLWLIGKDGAKSPNKIDLAMCAVLSWAARGDAIRSGVLEQPVYERAQW